MLAVNPMSRAGIPTSKSLKTRLFHHGICRHQRTVGQTEGCQHRRGHRGCNPIRVDRVASITGVKEDPLQRRRVAGGGLQASQV